MVGLTVAFRYPTYYYCRGDPSLCCARSG